MEISEGLIDTIITELAVTRTELIMTRFEFDKILKREFPSDYEHFLATRDVVLKGEIRKAVQEICMNDSETSKRILSNTKLYL